MRSSKNTLAMFIRANLTAAVLGCFVLAAGWSSLSAADMSGPTASDRHITNQVVTLLKKEHLSNRDLDDQVSQRGLETFLKSLDPMKMYFYQSDVDEFLKHKNDLDDMLLKKDVSLAYTVFNRFLQRVDERLKTIEKLLDETPDFSIDEEMVTDRDLRTYPRDEEEARDAWRKRIKYDLLVLKTDEKEGDEATDKLRRRYNSFAKRMHQFDNDELLEMYLTAVTMSYDPHTTFMSRSTLENFKISLGLKLEGIGAALRSEDGQTIVTKIIPGGAADKHGKLQVEDRIISVGQGDEGEMVDIVDMKLNDVVQQIRGDEGTIVRLGVIPAGENELKIYNITRAKIELKDSEARGEIIEEGKKVDGTPLKIGVINLPSFYMDMDAARAGDRNFKSTTRDMQKILEDFNEKGVDAVVLDLRQNGGGSLTEAINCTGLFIDHGPVVQVKDKDNRIQGYDDLERGMVWKGPLVVVTSKLSASASEILAGAIQDYGRGLVVGDEATHGKGTVQSLLDIGQQLFRIADPPNMGALKVTMQQFYRPNGESTQKRGVLADISLPSLTTHMDVGEGDLDFAIDFDRIPSARFSKVDLVNENIVNELRMKSGGRRSASEDWQKLAKNIERYREQKKQKTISLNEEKFFARRAELDADKEEEKLLDEENNRSEEEVVKRNFYFNEVLAITVDYVNTLAKSAVAQTN